MSDTKTLRVYAQKAQEYQDIVRTDRPDTALQRFLDHATPGGRVLDIGCGPGHAAGFMATAGLHTEAWDPVPEMRALAAAHPAVTVRDAGYADLKSAESYHGIWANFSMLHTPLAQWPAQFMAVHGALVPGGLFHFGTKLGTGEIRDSIGRLYSYMEEPALKALMVKTGFTIEYERKGSEAGLSGEIAPFIILQGRKIA